MELSSSALAGALRVGIQVAVARKRPVVEIYFHLQNRMGPEQDIGIPGRGSEQTVIKHRHQEIFIEFILCKPRRTKSREYLFRAWR